MSLRKMYSIMYNIQCVYTFSIKYKNMRIATKNNGVIIVRSLQLVISRFVIKRLSLAFRALTDTHNAARTGYATGCRLPGYLAWAIHIKSADTRQDTVLYGGSCFTLSLTYYIPGVWRKFFMSRLCRGTGCPQKKKYAFLAHYRPLARR